jgi:hypothetical protein
MSDSRYKPGPAGILTYTTSTFRLRPDLRPRGTRASESWSFLSSLREYTSTNILKLPMTSPCAEYHGPV